MRASRHLLLRARLARITSSAVSSSASLSPVTHVGRFPQPTFIESQRLFPSSSISSESAAIWNHQRSIVDTVEQGPANSGPLYEYERRVKSGELMAGDKNQVQALKALQRIYDELMASAEPLRLDATSPSTIQNRQQSGWFWKKLMLGNPSASTSVRGLYLYGGVGTGKTMLMDLFYDELPDTWRKRRTHFHDFMLNVHSRLQKHKGMPDPLEVVAEELSKESVLLCLDEFMVTDVADALILNRLFGHLFRRGTVLVTTSNRAPDKLYEGGLQRDLFLPFIALLKERCVAHEIGSQIDYRKINTAQKGFYFVGDEATDLLQKKFQQITKGIIAKPAVVEVVMGRKLQVPFAVNGYAYFQFHELCEMPLGAADYFGLFKNFHTLALEGVPVFGSHNRVAAYRFVTLIDVMYENRARLLCSAEAEPIVLFERVVTVADAPKVSGRARKNDEADLCVDNELGFAKDRTISRLTEMNSEPYLKEHEEKHHL